jgi:hypothetical protein
MLRRAILLLASAGGLAFSACGSSKPPPKLSDANRLVDIWKGAHVASPNADIRAVQAHLVSLTHDCGESERALASSVAAALKLLAEHGIDESPVALTAALDTAAKQRQPPATCSDVLVALLIRLESGHAGTATVEGQAAP